MAEDQKMEVAEQNLAERTGEVECRIYTWPPASEKRGKEWFLPALNFRRRFHDGKYHVKDFDQWALGEGLLESIPPRTYEDGRLNPEWSAHTRRRDHIIHGLRNAGSHPRMFQEGNVDPFTITHRNGSHYYWVVPPLAAIGDNTLYPQKILENLVKKIGVLLQSTDWTRYSIDSRIRCGAYYEHLQMDAERYKNELDQQIKHATKLLRVLEKEGLSLPILEEIEAS